MLPSSRIIDIVAVVLENIQVFMSIKDIESLYKAGEGHFCLTETYHRRSLSLLRKFKTSLDYHMKSGSFFEQTRLKRKIAIVHILEQKMLVRRGRSRQTFFSQRWFILDALRELGEHL